MKQERTTPPPRKNRGNWSEPTACPACLTEGTISQRLMPSTQVILDEEIHCQVNKWVCAACGAAWMTPAQATESVKTAVATYQHKHGLLTAEQIRNGRKRAGLSVEQLAADAKLGVATIKRIEAGTAVQRQSTNKLLESVFDREIEIPTDCRIELEWPDDSSAYPSYHSPWESKEPWWGGRSLQDIFSMGPSMDAPSANELTPAA